MFSFQTYLEFSENIYYLLGEGKKKKHNTFPGKYDFWISVGQKRIL